MAGRKLSAKDVVGDIKAGMDDEALETKYDLTGKQLAALYEKLTEKGLLDVGDLYSHTTVVEFPEADSPESASPDLIATVKSKDLAKLVTLVQENADLNVLDTDGATPVIVAAREGNESIAQFLVYSGADTTFKDASGQTALDWATEKGNENIVLLLQGKRFSCPACGKVQGHLFVECPKCGVIVRKYYDRMFRRSARPAAVASGLAEAADGGPQSPTPEYPASLPAEATATRSTNSGETAFSHRQPKGSADLDRSWFSDEGPWWKTILVVPVAFLVVIIAGGSLWMVSQTASVEEESRKALSWKKDTRPETEAEKEERIRKYEEERRAVAERGRVIAQREELRRAAEIFSTPCPEVAKIARNGTNQFLKYHYRKCEDLDGYIYICCECKDEGPIHVVTSPSGQTLRGTPRVPVPTQAMKE